MSPIFIAIWVAIVWLACGMFWVKRVEGGWLIMMTDRRNTYNTWMVWPALLLTWLLWPFCNRVARFMFILSRAF